MSDYAEYAKGLERRIARLEAAHMPPIPPAEQWKDVTAECELLEGVRLWHGEVAIADMNHGYRLRKLLFFQERANGQAAFIVEKRL